MKGRRGGTPMFKKRRLPVSTRLECLEILCQKMVNKPAYNRKVLVAGITNYTAKIKNKTNPAYERLLASLRRKMLRKCPKSPGLK